MVENTVAPDDILNALQALPGALNIRRELGELVLNVPGQDAFVLLRQLRDAFNFEQVMDICGVDYPGRIERFEVVYNLLSVTRNERIRVVVPVAAQTPVATVSSLWPNAT